VKPGGSFDILEACASNYGVEEKGCIKEANHSMVLSTRNVIARYWTGLRLDKGKGMMVDVAVLTSVGA
jgi:hypothetical protein